MVYVFTYGGLLLDLLVVPLLLWKPTRWFALAAAITFHLLNSQLFPIGIFPWLAIAATLLFLPPEWPRLVLSGKRLPALRSVDWSPLGRVHLPRNAVAGFLGVYLAVQLLVPLRHHLYDGNVLWTEEGFRFSWHVRIREKVADARFFATDPATGETWEVFPEDYLHNRQEQEMSIHSDMILQLAHYMADELRRDGYEEIEVRASVISSLNARDPQMQIDPEVDLAAQSRDLRGADWILPLE
jgi:hypothetical protein